MRTYTDAQFRVLYNTLELGAYHIRIFCDLQAIPDKEQRVLRLETLRGIPPVKSEAGLTSSTTQGYYSSESVFEQDGDNQTKIEYSLQLQAKLPTPIGLLMVPSRVVNYIAENIMDMRIHEIAEGFIERSIEAFPHWLAEKEKRGTA
jgi:hypothetical protein